VDSTSRSPTSQVKSGSATGDFTEKKIQNQSFSRLPPSSRSQLNHSKRRLATTRGFGQNKSLEENITPINSPFRPSSGSTPIFQQVLNSDNNSRPTLPGILAPPYSAISSVNLPVIRQPLTSVRTSVISPRISVHEESLDWDNYSVVPEFKYNNNRRTENINLSGITGIEEVRKITLVNTSESSLSMEDMPLDPKHKGGWFQQSQNMDRQAEIRVLQNMAKDVEEMMEDFTSDDVRKGNIDDVPRCLDEISKARTKFRNSVRDFKQTASLQDSDITNLDNSVAAINSAVRAMLIQYGIK